ncbi:hypothetical protein Ddye_010942 [Dipteronia dyeriana]|uniref:Zinc knuckle CX2CX4HX4C domain-containing protein n=1 Tax=Dipteronia dyeriana TaxID=168575 RepID=A0AAD9XEK0_9ROSI|nr:hypothetical protein Ddye_010942 [Dipteronia dyeriana]
MVWSHGPWNFDHCLIILEKPREPGEVSKMEFNRAAFWVQLYNVPLMGMNKQGTRVLTEKIWEVIELPNESRDCWGKFLCVKVGIDVTKPIIRFLRLWLDDFDTVITIPIKYERLPEFCYGCGLIGYSLCECINIEARKTALENHKPEFGDWLRLTPSSRPKGAKQKDNGQGSSSSGWMQRDNKFSQGKAPWMSLEIVNERDDFGLGATAKETARMGGYFMATGVDMGVCGVTAMSGVEICHDDVVPIDEPRNNLGFNIGRDTVKSPGMPNTRNWKWEAKKGVNQQDLMKLSSSGQRMALAQLRMNKGDRIRKLRNYRCQTLPRWSTGPRHVENNDDLILERIGCVWNGDGIVQGGTGHDGTGQDMLFCIVFGRPETELLTVLFCVWDFNEIVRLDEKKGGSDKLILGVCQFRQVIGDCQLEDLGYFRPMMTWNNRLDGDQNIEKILDRYLGDIEWRTIFPRVKVVHLGYNFFDHRPILLKLDDKDNEWAIGSRGFRFVPFWLKDDDCESIVKEAWAEYGLMNYVVRLGGKLAWCVAKMEAWSTIKFGSLRKKIIQKQEELENLFECSHEQRSRENICCAEKELEGLLDRDELYWK